MVHLGFPFDFDHLVHFPLLWVPVSHWGFKVYFPLLLFHLLVSGMVVHQGFSLDFDNLVQFPFLWVPVPHWGLWVSFPLPSVH